MQTALANRYNRKPVPLPVVPTGFKEGLANREGGMTLAQERLANGLCPKREDRR